MFNFCAGFSLDPMKLPMAISQPRILYLRQQTKTTTENNLLSSAFQSSV